jgi:hypothetical protein
MKQRVTYRHVGAMKIYMRHHPGKPIHVDGWYIANHLGLTTLVIYGMVMQQLVFRQGLEFVYET